MDYSILDSPEISGEMALAAILGAERGRISDVMLPGVVTDSPIGVALAADDDSRQMDWTLGLLGDLLWMLVPEVRPAIVARLVRELRRAVDHGRELRRIMEFQILEGAFEPVVEDALTEFDVACESDLLERCCVFISVARRFEGEYGEIARETIDDGVLSRLNRPEYVEKFRQVNPQVADLVSRCDFW